MINFFKNKRARAKYALWFDEKTLTLQHVKHLRTWIKNCLSSAVATGLEKRPQPGCHQEEIRTRHKKPIRVVHPDVRLLVDPRQQHEPEEKCGLRLRGKKEVIKDETIFNQIKHYGH